MTPCIDCWGCIDEKEYDDNLISLNIENNTESPPCLVKRGATNVILHWSLQQTNTEGRRRRRRRVSAPIREQNPVKDSTLGGEEEEEDDEDVSEQNNHEENNILFTLLQVAESLLQSSGGNREKTKVGVNVGVSEC